ncbi:MAG: histidine--tRNA ligase, partial [Anaerolineae bacterium]|nr:histidine--tRNA ligase [Anaerolineae bacterium]
MVFQAPRGTQDILPEEQPYWAAIEAQVVRLAALYGYRRLETPIFEDTGLYVRGVGESTDIVEKEMYTFLDKGGDSLSLRPEYTAGVVRAYLEHGMHTRPQPVKVYSVGPIFRYERPQAGRLRQHTQFNVEAIGEADPALDVEIMSVAYQLYAALGFQGLSYQLNSIGCPICRPGYVQRLVEYYRERLAGLCPECPRRLERNPLRLLDCKDERCQEVIAGAPRIDADLCPECARHFQTVLGYLDRLGRPYQLNHRLVRGLDYYTRTVFEVWAQGIGAQNALCGGGRYDGLAEALGGPPTPGVGFASGFERIILLMRQQRLPVASTPEPQVMVAPQGDEARAAGLSLVTALRNAGTGALLSFGERSLRAQLRQANRAGVRFVVIIGPEEMADSRATLRDMSTGEQWSEPQATVVEAVRARVGDVRGQDAA